MCFVSFLLNVTEVSLPPQSHRDLVGLPFLCHTSISLYCHSFRSFCLYHSLTLSLIPLFSLDYSLAFVFGVSHLSLYSHSVPSLPFLFFRHHPSLFRSVCLLSLLSHLISIQSFCPIPSLSPPLSSPLSLLPDQTVFSVFPAVFRGNFPLIYDWEHC